MQEDVKNDPKDRSLLLLQIETMKSQYIQKRHSVLWYIYLAVAVLITTSLAGLGASLLSAFSILLGTITFFLCIGFIFLIAMFFIEDAFNGIDRVKEIVSMNRNINNLQTHLQLFDDYQAQQRSPQERYKDELNRTILQYKRQANSYRRTHYCFQLFIILSSLFVTALTSGLANLIGFTDKQWITASVSFVVSFLTAITALFRFHDRGFNLQQTADVIEYEIKNAELRIYDYSLPLTDKEVLRKLAERGTRLIDEQRKRQLQLEQTSNTKKATE